MCRQNFQNTENIGGLQGGEWDAWGRFFIIYPVLILSHINYLLKKLNEKLKCSCQNIKWFLLQQSGLKSTDQRSYESHLPDEGRGQGQQVTSCFIIKSKEPHSLLSILSPNLLSTFLTSLVVQKDSCLFILECLKNGGLGAGSLLSPTHNIAVLLSQKMD